MSFVMIDAAVGIVSAAIVLSVFLSPVAGPFVLAIGSLTALVNFVLAGVPSAMVWAAIVFLCKRFGSGLRLACTIAAPVTAVFASIFLFVGMGLWLGEGNIDVDGANVIAIMFAPAPILLAPLIAWRIYDPGKAMNVIADREERA